MTVVDFQRGEASHTKRKRLQDFGEVECKKMNLRSAPGSSLWTQQKQQQSACCLTLGCSLNNMRVVIVVLLMAFLF